MADAALKRPDGAAEDWTIAQDWGSYTPLEHAMWDRLFERQAAAGLPLAQKLDDYLTADARFIACGWHDALFRKEDGHYVGAPCVGQSLSAWPVTADDGWIVTA
ncbi:hypothetical protein SAMN05518849_11211 [Sphingobium sp. AP50]|nr:hypothetical protein SAMN05518849_11211 [Sphingobium sp. AP50]